MKDFNASRCPLDPDNYWVDEDTGERVYAPNGERTVAPVYVAMLCSALMEQEERVERIERITTLEEAAAYVKAQVRDQTEVMNEPAHIPHPPVSNYDDEAEPSGERAGRMAYISNLARQEALARPKKGSWEDVFGHLGTPEEVGNMWHALTERVDRVEAMRHAIYHAEAEIKLMDDGIYGNYEVILWRLRGVPKTFYPTKMAAEVAARAHFPHDNATVRYSRVSFITVPIDSDNFESD